MSHAGAAKGGQLEDKVDLSGEVETKLTQAKALVDSQNLKEALVLLAALEKRCRVGNDTPSLIKVCQASLQYCKDVGDVESLVATLQTLSTRRSQKSAAVRAMVQLALPWVMDDEKSGLSADDRTTLVVALRDITDGKIFLEAERAQLTRKLAAIKEAEGDISGAATVLQEVHVETYGSLSKKDKIDFILEQLRLTLAKRDFIRAHIVAGKVSRPQLQQEEFAEYKVQFYTLMAQYHTQQKDALELAKDYFAIYSTPSILKDAEKWQPALQLAVLFIALASHSNEQQDLMNKIYTSETENLEVLPASKATLQLLLQPEIINYPMAHQEELWKVLTDDLDYWKETLHRRIVQHNIRVVSKYYKRIHGARLAELLGLDRARLEQEVSSMVSSGDLYCKMDRPLDILRFQKKTTPEAVLSDWAADIDKLLGLVETTTHLIQKENMTS